METRELLNWQELKCANAYVIPTGFDVGELSEDGPDDWEGLDASAAHIANLLSTEPPDGTIEENLFAISCLCGFFFMCHQIISWLKLLDLNNEIFIS